MLLSDNLEEKTYLIMVLQIIIFHSSSLHFSIEFPYDKNQINPHEKRKMKNYLFL